MYKAVEEEKKDSKKEEKKVENDKVKAARSL
jgi:hypothetical protein